MQSNCFCAQHSNYFWLFYYIIITLWGIINEFEPPPGCTILLSIQKWSTLGCSTITLTCQICPTFFYRMCICNTRSHAKFEASSLNILTWRPCFMSSIKLPFFWLVFLLTQLLCTVLLLSATIIYYYYFTQFFSYCFR